MVNYEDCSDLIVISGLGWGWRISADRKLGGERWTHGAIQIERRYYQAASVHDILVDSIEFFTVLAHVQ
jgi:hypothetical protein